MKLLLLGKDGQVGYALQDILAPLGEVIALGRQEANLEALSDLLDILNQYTPDVIVNAAAYTAVDKAESDTVTAYKVNAQAVRVLAGYAQRNNILLIHYSTDYVFDGTKKSAYLETDATNPKSVYGKSKLEGEEAILSSGCEGIIFRTSWVFSAHGGNFIKTILRLAKERSTMNIVADQHGTPTFAGLLAQVTALAIVAHGRGKLKKGIYHVTAAGNTTWCELAQYVVTRALQNGMLLMLKPEGIHPISTAEYPLPAKRPSNSCLDIGLILRNLDVPILDWRVYVNEVVDQLN